MRWWGWLIICIFGTPIAGLLLLIARRFMREENQPQPVPVPEAGVHPQQNPRLQQLLELRDTLRAAAPMGQIVTPLIPAPELQIEETFIADVTRWSGDILNRLQAAREQAEERQALQDSIAMMVQYVQELQRLNQDEMRFVEEINPNLQFIGLQTLRTRTELEAEEDATELEHPL